MNYDFFAYMARMKYIRRWCLMHSVTDENIMEHTQQVTVIAHALAVIGNKYYGKNYDVEKVLLLSTYHECSEVITGDLPTPIKYFNEDIKVAYKNLENLACEKILSTLPDELRGEYANFVIPDTSSPEYLIMKRADRIAAYLKCVEELKAGNKEFKKAKDSIGKELFAAKEEEVQYFLKNILPVYSKTLDELE